MTYRCRYFAIHELVPPAVYERLGERAWGLLDDRALCTIDDLRSLFGHITINNYKWGGPREWSGLRTPESPYYRPDSQHTFGRAFDCIFKHVTAESVRELILAEPKRFPFITSIEKDTSWLHFDVRNCHRIMTYNPS